MTSDIGCRGRDFEKRSEKIQVPSKYFFKTLNIVYCISVFDTPVGNIEEDIE